MTFHDLSAFNELLWDLIAFLVYLFPVVMLIKVIETFFIEVAIPMVIALFVSDGKITDAEKNAVDRLEGFFFVWTRLRATVILFFVGWILILFAIEYGKFFV